MNDRRDLRFAGLDEVMPEEDRLLAGYVMVGSWTLGQVCNHLATAFRLGTTGGTEPVARAVPAALRERFFRAGRFPDGLEAPFPVLVPQPGLDDRAEAEALREALRRFAAHEGPFPHHPALGALTRDEWARFHCLHCAHHLGFAVPT